MFPKQELEPACLIPVSQTLYNEWLEAQMNEYNTRQHYLNGSISLQPTPPAQSGRKKRNTFVRSDNFCATLLPRHGFFGINPKKQGNSLDAAIICQCSGVPWARVRKQIKYKTCYSPNMVDPKNDEFKDAKSEVEEAVISTHLLSTKIRSSIGNIDKQFL